MTLILGKAEGRKGRGWQRMRWLDGITDSTHVSLSKIQETVKDRKVWHTAVHGVAQSRTWRSDWTTATLLLITGQNSRLCETQSKVTENNTFNMLRSFVHRLTSKGQLFQLSNLQGFSVHPSFCCLQELLCVKRTKWALFRKAWTEQRGFFQVRGNRWRNKLSGKQRSFSPWPLSWSPAWGRSSQALWKQRPKSCEEPFHALCWCWLNLFLQLKYCLPGTSNQDPLEGIIWWRKTDRALWKYFPGSEHTDSSISGP